MFLFLLGMCDMYVRDELLDAYNGLVILMDLLVTERNGVDLCFMMSLCVGFKFASRLYALDGFAVACFMVLTALMDELDFKLVVFVGSKLYGTLHIWLTSVLVGVRCDERLCLYEWDLIRLICAMCYFVYIRLGRCVFYVCATVDCEGLAFIFSFGLDFCLLYGYKPTYCSVFYIHAWNLLFDTGGLNCFKFDDCLFGVDVVYVARVRVLSGGICVLCGRLDVICVAGAVLCDGDMELQLLLRCISCMNTCLRFVLTFREARVNCIDRILLWLICLLIKRVNFDWTFGGCSDLLWVSDDGIYSSLCLQGNQLTTQLVLCRCNGLSVVVMIRDFVVRDLFLLYELGCEVFGVCKCFNVYVVLDRSLHSSYFWLNCVCLQPTILQKAFYFHTDLFALVMSGFVVMFFTELLYLGNIGCMGDMAFSCLFGLLGCYDFGSACAALIGCVWMEAVGYYLHDGLVICTFADDVRGWFEWVSDCDALDYGNFSFVGFFEGLTVLLQSYCFSCVVGWKIGFVCMVLWFYEGYFEGCAYVTLGSLWRIG
eukprot:gene13109-8955_t